MPFLRPFSRKDLVAALGLGLVALPLTALPAAASTCADPDSSIDLEQRAADCEADLSYIWDRSGYPHLVFNLGRSLRLLGRNEEALPVLHEALGYNPNNPVYWAELGRLYLAMDEPGTAVAMYSQAVALEPADPYNPADRAEAWLAMGKADACITDLEAVLPKLVGLQDDAWFRNMYGRCLDAVGRYDEAVTAFDSANEAYPGYVDALGNKVYALESLGKYDQVLAASADLLDPAKTPDLSDGWFMSLHALRLEALGFLGRGDEGGPEIEALKAKFPGDLDVVNLEAWTLFSSGQVEAADKVGDTLRGQPEDQPLQGYMVDTLAQIDLAMGRVDQAMEGLKLAAWRDPGLAKGWVPALAAQGYLPQTRLADGILLAVRRCIDELGKDCHLAPLPVTEAAKITVSRPGAVVAPPAGAPAETPAFEPGPAAPPADPGAGAPPAEAPGLGTAPKGERPVVAAP